MSVEILERSLAERRRSTIGWCLGAAAYTLINVAVYPQVKSQSGLNDIFKEYPPALLSMMGIDAKTLDLTSAIGYLGSQMNMVGPLLLVMVGIAFGSASLGGEEESGTLAMVLSYPVSRTRVVVEKGVALLVVVGIMALALYATIVAGRLFDLDIPFSNLLAFCVSLALLGALFGMLALAVGAASGSKALGTGVAAMVAAATYLIGSLAPVVSGVRPLRWAVAVLVRHEQQPAGQRARHPGRGRARRDRAGALGGGGAGVQPARPARLTHARPSPPRTPDQASAARRRSSMNAVCSWVRAWRIIGASSPRRGSRASSTAGHGVDGQAGLVEVGRGLAEVDAGQVVEAAHVVQDHLRRRGRRQLGLHLGHLEHHRLELGPLVGGQVGQVDAGRRGRLGQRLLADHGLLGARGRPGGGLGLGSGLATSVALDGHFAARGPQAHGSITPMWSGEGRVRSA